MSRNSVIFLAVLILLLGGGYFAYSSYKTSKNVDYQIPTSTTAPSEQSSSPSATPTASSSVTISSTGFFPSLVTVNAKDTVTWSNQDTVNHTVSSDLHPTHLLYPPLNLEVITPGASKSLVFPSTGTYKYHDHLHPALVGQVVVK